MTTNELIAELQAYANEGYGDKPVILLSELPPGYIPVIEAWPMNDGSAMVILGDNK